MFLLLVFCMFSLNLKIITILLQYQVLSLTNAISFELWMETLSMLMIFAVMLCYLSSSGRKA